MKNWIEQIDENTETFDKHFGLLTQEELNWKPENDRWSIAQNLDHLIVINSSYFPALSELRNGTYSKPLMGRFALLVSFLAIRS